MKEVNFENNFEKGTSDLNPRVSIQISNIGQSDSMKVNVIPSTNMIGSDN